MNGENCDESWKHREQGLRTKRVKMKVENKGQDMKEVRMMAMIVIAGF